MCVYCNVNVAWHVVINNRRDKGVFNLILTLTVFLGTHSVTGEMCQETTRSIMVLSSSGGRNVVTLDWEVPFRGFLLANLGFNPIISLRTLGNSLIFLANIGLLSQTKDHLSLWRGCFHRYTQLRKKPGSCKPRTWAAGLGWPSCFAWSKAFILGKAAMRFSLRMRECSIYIYI